MAELRWRGLTIAALALVACRGDAAGALPESSPPRAGRFGSLRDFVLFELPATGSQPRWLLVDRFEVTRGDWLGFAGSPDGARVAAASASGLGDAALPQGLMSLRQARAFAAWRFARLPRLEEWEAVVRDGRYTFPWGNKADATRANTAELGLLEPTLVGTFESGRRGNGQPYDLIGNVSEWTETVPIEWCRRRRPAVPGELRWFATVDGEEVMVDGPEPFEHDGARIVPRSRVVSAPEIVVDELSLPYAASWQAALAIRALAVWQPLPGTMPAIAAVASRSEVVPRAVVGADFQSSMLDPQRKKLAEPEHVLGGDRRLRTGLRLMTTPTELLLALAHERAEPSAEDYVQLQRFVDRDGYLAVLRAAWAEAARQLTATQSKYPVARWLRERLGR